MRLKLRNPFDFKFSIQIGNSVRKSFNRKELREGFLIAKGYDIKSAIETIGNLWITLLLKYFIDQLWGGVAVSNNKDCFSMIGLSKIFVVKLF